MLFLDKKLGLWWDLPVIESFQLIQKMYQISNDEYQKNLKKFTEILDLSELLNKQVKNLSLGQKMRCEIAATFLHNPKVVYLDEPTIGLDILVKENIRKFIKDINQEKKTTIILTTHDLKDIEDVCDRIILLDKGQIIYDGTKEIFKNTYGKYIVAEFVVQNKTKNLSMETADEDFEVIEENEKYLKIKFNHVKLTIMDIVNCISNYCEILDLHIHEQDLEEILKELYRGDLIHAK